MIVHALARKGCLHGSAWLLLMMLVTGSCEAVGEAADALRVPTVTRLVQHFSALESEVHAAVRAHDNLTLQRALDEQFEMQVTAAGADVVARDAWIARALLEPEAYGGDIGDFAVRDYGDLVLVTFDWQVRLPGKKPSGETLFVVDSWRRYGNTWRLALRIVGPAKGPGARIPGWKETRSVDKRY